MSNLAVIIIAAENINSVKNISTFSPTRKSIAL